MAPFSIAFAFIFGLAVRLIGLPPLVGFLIAGFALHALGFESNDRIDLVADFGVYLLLFGIGLKLKLRSLARPEVWGTAAAHMLITCLIFAAVLFAAARLGAGLIGDLRLGSAALVAFALSFSSTVFAVKVFEETNATESRHGRIAIGILIIQDIIAILFLAVSLGKVPSVWALGLLALPLTRPVLYWLMTKSGHGELLVLLGVLLVAGSTRLFDELGVKADLGAIIVGVLVAPHAKADELSKTLLGFKDLFLVGFFLDVGLNGTPSVEMFAIAAVFAVLVPLKGGLFFLLMTKLRLRARTAFLGSLSLTNYSEFGLIVGVVGVEMGWMSEEWLVVLALALSISFALNAALFARSRRLYARLDAFLHRFESERRLPGDELIDPGPAQVAIFGMGRVGAATYEELEERYGAVVVGVDRDAEVVAARRAEGKRVVVGDATDVDFYAKARGMAERLRIVMLSMRNHREVCSAARLMRKRGFKGTIAAAAEYPDQIERLHEVGVDAAYDLLDNAGAGFADHVCEVVLLEPETA